MKFNCGLSWAEKRQIKVEELSAEVERLKEWHDYFCWWPTRIGRNDCRWLETVERKYEEADLYDFYGIASELVINKIGVEFRAKENK